MSGFRTCFVLFFFVRGCNKKQTFALCCISSIQCLWICNDLVLFDFVFLMEMKLNWTELNWIQGNSTLWPLRKTHSCNPLTRLAWFFQAELNVCCVIFVSDHSIWLDLERLKYAADKHWFSLIVTIFPCRIRENSVDLILN